MLAELSWVLGRSYHLPPASCLAVVRGPVSIPTLELDDGWRLAAARILTAPVPLSE